MKRVLRYVAHGQLQDSMARQNAEQACWCARAWCAPLLSITRAADLKGRNLVSPCRASAESL